jgi:thiosulfate reductase cytochrome b subunit
VRRTSHFSLRYNPQALASSLLPRFDPMAAKVRGGGRVRAALLRELAYLGVVVGVLPFALLESLAGRGGSIMVEARAMPGVSGRFPVEAPRPARLA